MSNHDGLEKLVLPIARWCVRRSIRLQDILQALKASLLVAAEEELLRSGNPVSDARLSAMTGVHRKDTRKRSSLSELPLVSHPTVRAVTLWQSVKPFVASNGNPRVLAIGIDGRGFMLLADMVGSDINAHALLFELERAHVVERTQKGVRLIRREVVITDRATDILAEQFNDVASCIEENLNSKNSPLNLQLKTIFDSIPARHAASIQRWILKEGSRFHEKVRRYLGQFDSDVNPRVLGVEDEKVEISVSAFSVTRKKSSSVRKGDISDE